MSHADPVGPLTDAGHAHWPLMQRALELARTAAAQGEVPVGAVIVSAEGQILGEGANAPIRLHDPTAHAEMLALRSAAAALGNYRLTGTTLVVTLEPCAMCAAAIAHARVAQLVFGATDAKGGAVISGPQLYQQPTLHHRPRVEGGLGAAESATMLQAFFRARRGGSASAL